MGKHGPDTPNRRKNDKVPATQTCPKGHVFQAGAIPKRMHQVASPGCYR